ncbi:elongation factor 1-alpha [Ziziphus jujuba]|uniref:Elongation factor 1-alpha n=1 Tax=Ziziphus jujuba TaxID=326968 RepID=A0A6P6FRC7_ZIZJJ|nr:elongation factor 1-alpha [Ziziphus jujuba]
MNEIKFDYTRVLDNLKAVRERGITIDNATRELETDKYHSLSLMLMRIETLWRTGSWADCALLFFVYTLGVKQMIWVSTLEGVLTALVLRIWVQGLLSALAVG